MMISKPLPLKSLLFQAPKYVFYFFADRPDRPSYERLRDTKKHFTTLLAPLVQLVDVLAEFRMRLISFFLLSLPKALEDGSSSSSGSSSGYGSQNAVKIEEKNPGKKPCFLTFSLHVGFLFVLSIFCVCSFFVRFYYQHNHSLLQD